MPNNNIDGINTVVAHVVGEMCEPASESYFRCSGGCDSLFSAEKIEFTDTDGKEFCKECFKYKFFTCDDCNGVFENYEQNEVGLSIVCSDCYNDNYFRCERCGDTYNNDEQCVYDYDSFCSECFNVVSEGEDDEDNESVEYRAYDKSDKYVDKKHRIYAVEIESYYKDFEAYKNVKNNIDPYIGMVYDGSLNSRGIEFVTPKLSGKIGDSVLKGLCSELIKNKYSVDKTCGLHVHLDSPEFKNDIDKLKILFLLYMYIEPVIYSFLPYSRRVNRYCMPLSQFYQQDEINNACNIHDIEKIWYREQETRAIEDKKAHKYDSSRYAGVNFHSLLSNGHLEIRHHSGTIDYKKISNWIKLHIAILDSISSGNITIQDAINVKNILDLKQRQDKLFDMINLPLRNRAYFKARAKKFTRETKINEEILCAE